MNINIEEIRTALQKLTTNQDGQDLIEYALVVALIALPATASMNTVASDVNSAFSSLGAALTGYTG
jgi:pilus assembly protein Flp/PilA